MSYENAKFKWLETVVEFNKVIEDCRHADSDGGIELTKAEFEALIFPANDKLLKAKDELYKELVTVRSSQSPIMMEKCIECEKNMDSSCDVFKNLDVTKNQFRFYAERHNNLCIHKDFDEGLSEGFYMPDGKCVEFIND